MRRDKTSTRGARVERRRAAASARQDAPSRARRRRLHRRAPAPSTRGGGRGETRRRARVVGVRRSREKTVARALYDAKREEEDPRAHRSLLLRGVQPPPRRLRARDVPSAPRRAQLQARSQALRERRRRRRAHLIRPAAFAVVGGVVVAAAAAAARWDAYRRARRAHRRGGVARAREERGGREGDGVRAISRASRTVVVI